MTTLQSWTMVFAVLALAAAPWVVQWVRKRDAEQLPTVMDARQTVGWLLYADHCRGDRDCLRKYERSSALRAPWEAKADEKLSAWRK